MGRGHGAFRNHLIQFRYRDASHGTHIAGEKSARLIDRNDGGANLRVAVGSGGAGSVHGLSGPTPATLSGGEVIGLWLGFHDDNGHDQSLVLNKKNKKAA